MNNAEFLKKAMKTTADAVERQLEKFLPLPEGGERTLFEAMRYSMFGGGKKLRPFLVVASSDLFNIDKAQSIRVP